ncbi:MAG: ABC transporter substrate-binding protein [Verrucomicrobia bacterium]|nr:ABC transporter substrate-binding protein [Verrucomicrobiota bacterium]
MERVAKRIAAGVNKTIQATRPGLRRTAKLRVGFVPLTDCAPLVMAHELGLFEKFGLDVALHRELGWATVRNKIIFGELDAAHAVVGMPFAATLGISGAKADCVTGLVLSLHGNAITLSDELWQRGVRDGARLRQFIAEHRRERTLTFGVVSLISSHCFLLREWLAAAGVDADREVRIVVVPPPQMPENLKAGHLHGCCVGEPWNSVMVASGAGFVAATSAELAPGHPEKVLMVRRDFAEQFAAEHEALIAALLEACEFCDEPANREQVIATLARREYVNAAPAALRAGLSGEFDFGHGVTRRVPEFGVFSGPEANEPSADKASWALRHLRASGLVKNPADLTPALGARVFRADIFERASRLRSATPEKKENETPDTQLTLA